MCICLHLSADDLIVKFDL